MDHKNFKPFDKVLTRLDDDRVWSCRLYSHWDGDEKNHITIDGIMFPDEYILPFEDNEYLVGTTGEPDEEVKLEEGEFLMLSDFISGLESMFASVGKFIRIIGEKFLITCNAGELDYKYAIRFSDFNPNDKEETSRHILCVKNGRIIRYKG